MILLQPLVILTIFSTIVSSDYLTQLCDKNNNYTTGSIYEANLKQLQSSLLSSVIPSGYTNTTIGQNPNQVFGLALCRGDLSAEICLSRLETAINEASTRCPYGKDEVIWYEDCFLHYSDSNFFSKLKHFYFYSCSTPNATDPQQFTIILGQLMNSLISHATSSSNMFAAGFVNYTSLNKLYGLVQCTRDISKYECYQCLQGTVENIPIYCDGRIRGILYGQSCSIRYQLTIFYNTSAVPNAAAPSTPPPADTTNKGNNDGGSSNVARITILVVGPAFAALAIVAAVWLFLKWARKKRQPLVNIGCKLLGENSRVGYNEDDECIGTSESPIFFDLSTITCATNNFSKENKLGEGGFGPVYMGVLTNGQQIAVKKLSSNSHQGVEHLKNELKLLAKLQHKNLVKLFGCCLDGLEKFLVYEYLSNTSLDKFLFEPVKQTELDWQTRIKIIEGVARGLVYLHEDSRLKIVHRDLKASNILLDADMNPKISDFGLAKLFDLDATHATTSRIAGTYGYMAPEYAMRGLFSTKSDVFSYGILLLEILTGRTVCCMTGQKYEDLLSYVWRHWEQSKPLEAIDRSVSGQCPSQELIRCMHIALLCVQEEPSERPDMATVILMLRSRSMTLQAPISPRFFKIATSTGADIDFLQNYIFQSENAASANEVRTTNHELN